VADEDIVGQTLEVEAPAGKCSSREQKAYRRLARAGPKIGLLTDDGLRNRNCEPAPRAIPRAKGTIVKRIGHSALEVYPLNLGGNPFGWTSDEETSLAVLDDYAAAGGNFIDTSDSYMASAPGLHGGESETIIGRWMASRGNRDRMVIATKVSRHPDFRGLAADTIARAVEASLARLQTDVIDLYYAHYDDESVPMAETLGAFDMLVRAGKVRYLGISNYRPARIQEWIETAETHGFARPVALQPHYNLVQRTEFERSYRPVAERYELGVLPYWALASGFLTGKYRSETDLQGSTRERMVRTYYGAASLRVVELAAEIARGHDTEIASIALAWLRQQPTVVAPIASARTPEQLTSLTASTTIELSDDELARLSEASLNVETVETTE
jgi:aryl-alcohol dehydrogenase-like predicted oxidoreductase